MVLEKWQRQEGSDGLVFTYKLPTKCPRREPQPPHPPPKTREITATAGGSLQEGVAGGHGRCGASARCVNEEVIQVARVSPSAAFIRSRSSSAIRGRERRSDTVGVGR